jgi:hypothetical protein
MAFRHKRLPTTTGSSLPFPPHFLGTYYPLFRVISITMSPSRQPYHTCATSSSQAPWRSFPSGLTDTSLLETLVLFYCMAQNSPVCAASELYHFPWPCMPLHGVFLTFTDRVAKCLRHSLCFAGPIDECIHGARAEHSLTKSHPFVVQSVHEANRQLVLLAVLVPLKINMFSAELTLFRHATIQFQAGGRSRDDWFICGKRLSTSLR